MPDTAKIKEVLTRKVGPLPVIAWVGVGVGGYLVYRALSGGGGGGASSTTFDPTGSPIDLGGAGSSLGSGSDSGAADPGTVTDGSTIPIPVPVGSGTTPAPGNNASGVHKDASGAYVWCPPKGVKLACHKLPAGWTPGTPLTPGGRTLPGWKPAPGSAGSSTTIIPPYVKPPLPKALPRPVGALGGATSSASNVKAPTVPVYHAIRAAAKPKTTPVHIAVAKRPTTAKAIATNHNAAHAVARSVAAVKRVVPRPKAAPRVN